MPNERMSDEMLMAYVDHELDDRDAKAVEEAADADERIAHRLRDLRAQRRSLREAFAGLAEEPVPAALSLRVREMIAATGPQAAEASIVPFPARKLGPRVGAFAYALAASIAVLAVGLGVYLAGGPFLVAEGETLALGRVTSTEIATALSTLPSGDSRPFGGEGGSIRMVNSFKDGHGHLCREFEIEPARGARTLGVACRPAADWTVSFALAAGVGESGYAPASTLETLDAYLQSLSAGEPLSPQDERAALARR